MCLFSDDYIRPGVSLQVKQNGGYRIFCYAASLKNLSLMKCCGFAVRIYSVFTSEAEGWKYLGTNQLGSVSDPESLSPDPAPAF
jgi:hypothetical protein